MPPNERAAFARRRRLLARGLGLSLGVISPALPGDAAADRGAARRSSLDHAVPPHTVSLADFGGAPGAGRAQLVRAFGQAFAALGRAGGGTLVVPPGLYDFGDYADAAYIVLCRDLRDIAISAYGATFRATTRAKVVPNLFYFFNFDNISIAGARFTDPGFTPWVNWQGMYCVGLQADRASSGFRLVDCQACRVLGLLGSNNTAATRQYMSGIRVQGRVENAYYGVGASFIRRDVQVELACHNVRRAFIANALRDADIRITSSNTALWPGSNGLVALVSSGASSGDVENVRVKVSVSGDCIHGSYVHFYHQGAQPEGSMRDIEATVEVFNMARVRRLFVFDHEDERIETSTARRWDRIVLRGRVLGPFRGELLTNTSASTAGGTVWVEPGLARLGRLATLPRGFRVGPPVPATPRPPTDSSR
ncbi:hypothetical protein LK542_23295 [Massilia sp. IC2-477]|uniref:hypothetical protein n=1 Tax=Massilia sp. IC2-477 TaxID=2887198 RepID=UPI001D11A38C|nr:hypothetical protein [Massilia sp. IC2-477]MCC2958542.1 hypothetical protein [Massilia sp. IC2-477]